jgi:hypothetical protein
MIIMITTYIAFAVEESCALIHEIVIIKIDKDVQNAIEG